MDGDEGPRERTGCCQVVTTTGSREEALTLARSVVEARLAACVQVLGPVTSVYRWQGQVETAEEWQCLMKTTDARYAELEAHVRAHHSYDVPEVLRVPLTGGSADYLGWLRTETTPA